MMYSLHLTSVVSERMVLSAKKEMDSRSTHVCHDKMYVKCDITEVKKNPLSFKDRKKFEKYPQVITKIFFVMWEELEGNYFLLSTFLGLRISLMNTITVVTQKQGKTLSGVILGVKESMGEGPSD